MSMTPLLDTIHSPADLRLLSPRQLPTLANELRHDLIQQVSRTGGHLGAGLGVVELTVALHYIFNTPQDQLIWDVGHQAYPHKILTGRRENMHTLRKEGGLSGFCKMSESTYDAFGAGHSSTSISAALGMAEARDQLGKDYHVAAIIGDGAMSAGMAYEALNNAGAMKTRMTVILNDNDMSIAPPVGAMSSHLSRLASSQTYQHVRDVGKQITEHLPSPIRYAAKRAEQYARSVTVGGGSIFEELGMYYIGPVDGHDIDALCYVMKRARSVDHDRPVLIHVVTKKGKGYAPAESSSNKYHGVGTFDPDSGKQQASTATIPSYTHVFADALIQEAASDPTIVAVTAAMPCGTGLDRFATSHPKRCYDVGIAEQHAVTFAAGMACQGLKPFVAIYSTFLQRAYDQIVHDVAIQNLPVRFAIDRAGLVGADGATHAGMFDVAFLCCLPNMVVMAAGDEAELVHMVHTAAHHDTGPIAFRYPRGSGRGLALPTQPERLPIGKGRIIDQPDDACIAIISFGGRLDACIKAVKQSGVAIAIADARFAKPLDEALITAWCAKYDTIITLEEGSSGGFAAQVMQMLATQAPQHLPKLRPLTLPDKFQHHGDPEAMYAEAGMDASAIADLITSLHRT